MDKKLKTRIEDLSDAVTEANYNLDQTDDVEATNEDRLQGASYLLGDAAEIERQAKELASRLRKHAEAVEEELD